ncbi:hypothetical protein M885DRAFT_532937 [Pelagophyceae sp. CCMP2097]|nr:hypothetical protein M885DRAFT_532937 [Pelagophyceae sp. CCMP2097]|mmetsp:Transcript_32523/g.112500  ORF Transcript_32523/g.112500 Transcript_32523/m.112500 type:complete len:367 (-) Transcript_32523:22-1122(-)
MPAPRTPGRRLHSAAAPTGDVPARSTVSIPSKFETIQLQGGPVSDDAFGGRTQRFLKKRFEDDMPGPGTYTLPSSMARSFENTGTVSYKGSITFASSSERFRHQNRGTPGPGSYAVSKSGRRDFRAAPQTRVFHDGRAAPLQQRSPRSRGGVRTPGPGTYDPADAVAGPQKLDKRGDHAFTSVVDRFGRSGPRGGPAPGAYDVGSAADVLHNHGRLPGVWRSGEVPVASAAEGLPRSLDGPSAVRRRRSAPPGPGTYDVSGAFELGNAAALRHSSSMFSNIQLDRWGRLLHPRVPAAQSPGPGWYEKDTPLGTQEFAASDAVLSSFVSTSKRIDTEARQRKPGPAYYRPEPPSRKSFLLNTQRQWV